MYLIPLFALLLSCPIAALADTPNSKPLKAKCCSEACFEPLVRIDEIREVKLRNCVKYTYLWFDLYNAAFYSDPAGACGDIFSPDCSKKLELRYLRDFSVKNFTEGAETILEKQGLLKENSIKLSVALFHSFYRPVEKGDSYALQYTPEKGTSLVLNGKTLGTIKGHEFANAYFGIWLGKDSLDDKSGQQLLSN
jgi:hypothetical protein